MEKHSVLTLDHLNKAIETIKYGSDIHIGYITNRYNLGKIVMPKLKKVIKTMKDNSKNNHFNIPDVTYNVPVEEFFKWYDDILERIWNNMSDKEIITYFNNMSVKEKKNYDSQIKKSKDKNFINYAADKRGGKIYYKLHEFTNLENDAISLQKMMKKFLIEKSIAKMQEPQENQTLAEFLNTSGGSIP